METKRVTIDAQKPEYEWIQEGAKLIREGKLVALPTETVYGLGANAIDAEACQEIFRVKGRPQDNPLIAHISDLDMAKKLTGHWTPQAALCAEQFWPGPLTLVLEKTDLVPDVVSGGLGTVGIRMPNHPVALQLIQEAGVPIAAPSANLSGKPSPTKGSHVWKDLKGKIPLILDAGACSVGVESTVLDLTGEVPIILRPGGVTKEQLEEVLGEVAIDHPSEQQAPKAPGMKYRHYAPKGDLTLLIGERAKVIRKMVEEIRKGQSRLKKVGILCTLESAAGLHYQLPDLLYVLGSENNPAEVAGNLYEGLRLCDEQGMDIILAEGVSDKGLGFAIMNRLIKASGQKVLRV
ncbi:translation factor SUA5 [Desulfitobacterium dichloroeliminans LMG P-21439]|uniref:Threonylcarbamoyl-AMP synthase n=1 Tax=Desulfitobacterium dichloroeliminans (strain LMG P-21439 / DCA1) TaxID=871963 RepID=L0FDW0_DESDL|nr:L-threonylcarbamoyladenylate synthase [Desulfitobacterium dichloroeliminans]AGA70841.1 translation factor SUA5 [Desulfitobacterium dichloroeliminans LMG P-21439]